jgi:hypothetical protein
VQLIPPFFKCVPVLQDTKALLEQDIQEAHQNLHRLASDVKELELSLEQAKVSMDNSKREWKVASKDLSPPQIGAILKGKLTQISIHTLPYSEEYIHIQYIIDSRLQPTFAWGQGNPLCTCFEQDS